PDNPLTQFNLFVNIFLAIVGVAGGQFQKNIFFIIIIYKEQCTLVCLKIGYEVLKNTIGKTFQRVVVPRAEDFDKTCKPFINPVASWFSQGVLFQSLAQRAEGAMGFR